MVQIGQRRLAPLLIALMVFGGFGTASAAAQHGGPGAGDPAAPPGHEHGGAGGGQGHLAAQSCATQFEAVIASGRGFGMAFAADQNGYPGPMHVLELASELQLRPDQRARMQALMEAMFAESRPQSARLLDAERKLRALFAEGRATDASVRAAVADVERARTDVRLIHLLTHLKTRDVLSEAQRQRYHQTRWGRS